MDVLQQVLGNAGLGVALTAAAGAVVLVLRELTGALIVVWAMQTKKPAKEELALKLLCFVWPRRGERFRARMADAKAQVPRPRKPSAAPSKSLTSSPK